MLRLTSKAVFRSAAVLILLGVLMVLVALTKPSAISIATATLLIGVVMFAIASQPNGAFISQGNRPRASVPPLAEWDDDRYGHCYAERDGALIVIVTERSPQNPNTHRLQSSSTDAANLRAYTEDVFIWNVPKRGR